MDISVIIASWNAKQFLDNCLKSICDDEMDYSIEVIVVDNDSSDGSPEMVLEKYPLVKLIQTGENLGFSKANNIGIKEATGRYISLVNSDIKIFSGCFKNLLTYMDMNQDIAMTGPKILNDDLTLQLSTTKFPSIWYSFVRVFALDSIFVGSKLFNPRSNIFREPNKIQEVEVLIGCFLS
jgi:GT2 family glycosyltransferase